MSKREIFMLSSVTFSLGIICGFLISPIKQGIIVAAGDNNTNNNLDKRISITKRP